MTKQANSALETKSGSLKARPRALNDVQKLGLQGRATNQEPCESIGIAMRIGHEVQGPGMPCKARMLNRRNQQARKHNVVVCKAQCGREPASQRCHTIDVR